MENNTAENSGRILLVEDDHDASRELKEYLSAQGFVVDRADDAASMRLTFVHQVFDLVIMDWRLPGEDGLSLTREIRAHSAVPIIMLTGKTDMFDRVVGLEVGADDYVTKPFEPRELLARIRSVLRRTSRFHAGTGADAEKDILEFDGWSLNLGSRDLIAPDGRLTDLTTAEYKLLEAFVESPQRVLSRDYLLDRVHGRELALFERSIDNLVARLRRKLNEDKEKGRYIKTVRNAGYMFAVPIRTGGGR